VAQAITGVLPSSLTGALQADTHETIGMPSRPSFKKQKQFENIFWVTKSLVKPLFAGCAMTLPKMPSSPNAATSLTESVSNSILMLPTEPDVRAWFMTIPSVIKPTDRYECSRTVQSAILPLTIDLEAPALELEENVKARQGILGRLNLDTWRSSTKIEALVEELSNLRMQDSSTKSLVFSQFVNFLDLISFRLQKAGFKASPTGTLF
jgi:hypothetical protein